MSDDVQLLVLSSGGAKGIQLGGVLRALTGHIEKVDQFAGTSIGALVSLALALRYTVEEIISLCLSIDLSMFLEKPYDHVAQLSLLYQKMGLHDAGPLFKFVSSIVRKKAGLAKLTFQQMYDHFGSDLCVTACCMNNTTTRYFSRRNGDGGMSVAKAVTMSSCIPGFFTPISYQDRLWVDGATFGHSMPFRLSSMGVVNSLNNILGVRLLDPNPENEHYAITNSWDFMKQLAWGLTISRKEGPVSFPCIDVYCDIRPTSHSISRNRRFDIMLDAYSTTMEFLIDKNK